MQGKSNYGPWAELARIQLGTQALSETPLATKTAGYLIKCAPYALCPHLGPLYTKRDDVKVS